LELANTIQNELDKCINTLYTEIEATDKFNESQNSGQIIRKIEKQRK
jgi:hypothetical protein